MSKADVRYDDAPTAYGESLQFVRSLYDKSEEYKAACEAGPLSVNWVISVGNEYGTENKRKYARVLNRLRQTPGLNEHAQAVTGDPTYDYADILNQLRLACRDIQDECYAGVPKDGSNVLQAYTINDDCSISTVAMTVAEMAFLPPLFDAVMNLVDRGVLESGVQTNSRGGSRRR